MALRAEALTVHIGERAVVEDVWLTLQPGTWTAIVGPNGAGKSSLLQGLAGLRRATSGQVWLMGRLLAQWPAGERARALAWLSQHAEVTGELAVRDVVALGRLPHHGLFGAPGAADVRAVDEALACTDCTALAWRRLDELSGGERQRVLLAR
ncbi:MAG: ABC transporter ATP-binding protein, partial [Rubrivivax sp.]